MFSRTRGDDTIRYAMLADPDTYIVHKLLHVVPSIRNRSETPTAVRLCARPQHRCEVVSTLSSLAPLQEQVPQRKILQHRDSHRATSLPVTVGTLMLKEHSVHGRTSWGEWHDLQYFISRDDLEPMEALQHFGHYTSTHVSAQAVHCLHPRMHSESHLGCRWMLYAGSSVYESASRCFKCSVRQPVQLWRLQSTSDGVMSRK